MVEARCVVMVGSTCADAQTCTAYGNSTDESICNGAKMCKSLSDRSCSLGGAPPNLVVLHLEPGLLSRYPWFFEVGPSWPIIALAPLWGYINPSTVLGGAPPNLVGLHLGLE